ncbi:MAG: hypothetical protein AB1659_08175 [Thermodesulfobacteriota bacterium]
MTGNKSVYPMLWGIALVLAGIGIFFRIPQVMPRIESIGVFSSSFASAFIRFCFYFMGVILIGGGSKKIYGYFHLPEDRDL